MLAALCMLLAVGFGTSARDEGSEKEAAPAYSAGSLVNPANNRPGPFAPNEMVALYGTDLAYATDSASPQTIKNNLLPVKLKPGVQVLLLHGKLGTPLPLQLVSPTQINFMLPASMDPGDATLTVVRDSIYGPLVQVAVQDVAPALAESPRDWAVAGRLDGSLITADSPALPGEWVALQATGLGPTLVRLQDGEIPMVPPLPAAGLSMKRRGELQVFLDGLPVDPARVGFAGATPGVPGLYQVYVQLPDLAPPDPEVRIAVADRISLEGIRLPLRPPASAPPDGPVVDPTSPDPLGPDR